MLISRIELRESASAATVWRQLRGGYATHRLVWRWLSEDASTQRDFLYRQEGAGCRIRFLTLSPVAPVVDESIWSMDCKEYAPRLSSGDSLRFLVRVSPTRRRSSGPGKGKRHDVVMDAKHNARGGTSERQSEAVLVQRECVRWLGDRTQRCGFSFDPATVRADGYRCHQLRKPGVSNPIRFSSVELEGRLTVKDPVVFVEMLKTGLGPSKAFGCGMFLVKRD